MRSMSESNPVDSKVTADLEGHAMASLHFFVAPDKDHVRGSDRAVTVERGQLRGWCVGIY